MIDVLPVNACTFEPAFQGSTVDEMHDVVSTQFPSDLNVEAQRKDLVELFCWNILGSENRTA